MNHALEAVRLVTAMGQQIETLADEVSDLTDDNTSLMSALEAKERQFDTLKRSHDALAAELRKIGEARSAWLGNFYEPSVQYDIADMTHAITLRPSYIAVRLTDEMLVEGVAADLWARNVAERAAAEIEATISAELARKRAAIRKNYSTQS